MEPLMMPLTLEMVATQHSCTRQFLRPDGSTGDTLLFLLSMEHLLLSVFFFFCEQKC